MYEAKNTQRALVRIGYDGRVYKIFRGPEAESRFNNEIKVLRTLEERNCDFVPRLLEADPEKLQMVTTNCGTRVEQMGDERVKEIFAELEKYGVKHDDPFLRNITYRSSDGRFCIIDFEFATIGDFDKKAETNSQPSQPALPLAKSLRWSGMTHPGKFRKNNEDSFLAILLDKRGVRYLGKLGEASPQTSDLIFAVSDGMGGEKSGEFASKISVEKITSILPKYSELTSDRFAVQCSEIIHELFESIHNEMTLLGRVDSNCYNMGATLSLVWFKKEIVCFGHIGDSRIYHLPVAGGIHQLTDDHTHVGWLRKNGKLNEREARSHPRKNVLSQALGAGHRYLHPQIGSIQYQPGDQFLLCTDGVIDGLWDRGIEELIRQPLSSQIEQLPAQRLVLEAVKCSGRDNATAVVVEAL